MANEVTRNSASKKDIYEKLLNIAGKYTDVEETDYLKSGLFGYMTETMAMAIRDSALQKSMLYNEHFLNTAIIPSTVYNWAKMFNIEVNRATPAYATIKIVVPEDSLIGKIDQQVVNIEKYGLESGATGIVIDKSNMIIAGSYYFSLEHSILIYESSSGKVVAKYILTEDETTTFETVKGKLLPISYDNGNILIEARAYQYQQRTINRQLSSSNYENKIQTFEFTDQFCGARLYYEYNGITSPVTLRYSNIVGTTPTEDEKYAYYSLTASNELQIKFNASSTAGFMPASNSRLILKLFTTKGTNIERNFSGDAIFRFSDDSMKILGIIVQFRPTTILGGSDTPSTEKLKKTIIKELSTCNTIVTENDLNNYFETLTQLLETVNNGKVTFVKKRDDILKRVFNTFILLRDGLNDFDRSKAPSAFISKCVPTNTLPKVKISSGYNNYKSAFLEVEFNSETGEYEEKTTPGTDNYYFSPFAIKVSYTPIKRLSYIYPLTDTNTTLGIEDDKLSEEGSNDYVIPQSIRVYRGLAYYSTSDSTSAQNDYLLRIKVETNLSVEELKAKNYTYTLSLEDNYGTPTPLSSTSSDYTIEKTEDEGILIIQFKIDAGDITGSDYSKLEKQFVKFNITNSNGTMKSKSDNELYFFRKLDDIMSSELEIVEDIKDGQTIITGTYIKDLPVVHSSFIAEAGDSYEDINSAFVEQLFTYIDLLKENLGKLETSTFFNLKFYNTYGLSYFYNSQKTNLDLNLTIYLRDEYKNNASIQKEITSYIRRVIDKSNERNEILISSLIGILGRDDTYGNYIHHIEWNGLNGLFNQYIHKIDTQDARKAAPEWLNIQPETFNHIEFK